MNKLVIGALLAPALAFAAVAAADDGAADGAPAVNVRTEMVEGVNPAALAIWDVGNAAINEKGEPDGSDLDAETLARLKDAARTLADYARRMATAETNAAAGPDLVGGAVPEGVASREQIQAAIDADPDGFRTFAAAMGEQAEAIAAAVDSGDKQAVAEVLLGFDGACQSCHERYWYAQ